MSDEKTHIIEIDDGNWTQEEIDLLYQRVEESGLSYNDFMVQLLTKGYLPPPPEHYPNHHFPKMSKDEQATIKEMSANTNMTLDEYMADKTALFTNARNEDETATTMAKTLYETFTPETIEMFDKLAEMEGFNSGLDLLEHDFLESKNNSDCAQKKFLSRIEKAFGWKTKIVH